MAQKPSQEFISGPPTGASEGIRKVEIQNASSKLWVYGIKLEDDPNYVGPGIITNADSVQPNPTQQVCRPFIAKLHTSLQTLIVLKWKLVLVDRDVHHYRVQHIGTHKYASVGEPPEKGSNISQDDTARLWKITEDGQSHYMWVIFLLHMR